MQIIKVEEFSEFLQQTLNSKADCYLASLFKCFGQFFSSTKKMIEYLIELDSYFDNEQLNVKDIVKPKTLINNAIYLLNLFYQEHTQFIQWSYCEQFVSNGNERITQIRANIHPIFHLFDQTKIKKGLCDILINLQEKNTKLQHQMTLLSNEINLHQIILKQKEEQYKKFNDSIEYIRNQQQKLMEDREFQKYYTLFLKLLPMQQQKYLNDLYKSIVGCLINFSAILTLLEVPIENAKMVKQLGKKTLKGNTHEVQLIMKIVQILINREQIWNNLNKQHFDEVVEAIKLLEKQPFYKQSNEPFTQQFNIGELRSNLSKKEQLMGTLFNQLKKQETILEWNTIQPLGLITITQLQEILGMFFGHLSIFMRINLMYQQTKQEITKFFDQNFGQIVSLEYNEFDQLSQIL